MPPAPNDNDNDSRPAAFDARVMEYVPGLRKLAARYRRDSEQRQDLVTDTIASALENWRLFRGDFKQDSSGFWTWLAWRMRGIVKNEEGKAGVRNKHAGVKENWWAGRANQPSPADYAELSSVLGSLSTIRHGDVLLQRAMGGTLQEIAESKGLSHARVYQMERDARSQLIAGAA